MKMSRRAQRMDRHHKRRRLLCELNMVSLMDIFTILVFFLLVNSSDVEILPSTKSVRLPDSVAEKAPKQTVVVVVNDHDIVVQGRRVASVDAVMGGGDVINALLTELDYQTSKAQGSGQSRSEAQAREITIMGDKEIPYKLLKKIMVTCVSAKYENIALAVMKKAADKG